MSSSPPPPGVRLARLTSLLTSASAAGKLRSLTPVGLNESADDHGLTFSLQSHVGPRSSLSSLRLLHQTSLRLSAASIKAGLRDILIQPANSLLLLFFPHRYNRGRHIFVVSLFAQKFSSCQRSASARLLRQTTLPDCHEFMYGY